VHSFCAHDREVCALSWGENNLIASCAVDGKISVWDPALPACCRATCHSMQLWRAEEGPYRVRRGTFIRGWATWLDRDTGAGPSAAKEGAQRARCRLLTRAVRRAQLRRATLWVRL
jgi:hypothetical protein